MGQLLTKERKKLDQMFPGLDASLAEMGIERLETPDGSAIAQFRSHGLALTLVDEKDGGLGATASDLVQMQMALASRAPSLAIATCMHHYKLAAVMSEAKSNDQAKHIYHTLIAKKAILGSGGAEGQLGKTLYQPTTKLSEKDGQFVVNGLKRPLSLSQSMTYLSGMAAAHPDSKFGDQLVHFFLDAAQPGVSVKPFWNNPVLTVGESHEVLMEDAIVAPDMILPLGQALDAKSFAYACYGWFELSACAAYTGILTALLEWAMAHVNPPASSIGNWSVTLGQLKQLITAMAKQVDDQPFDEELVTSMFQIRYAAEQVIVKTAMDCFSHIGGFGYATTGLPLMLLNICLALQFHPPRRHQMEQHLGQALATGQLELM